MAAGEIVLPIRKPETEWTRGRALRKVSPTRDHARVQGALVVASTAWSDANGDAGEIGPELRSRLAPEGEVRRPLVPDVSFVRADGGDETFAHDALPGLNLPPAPFFARALDPIC